MARSFVFLVVVVALFASSNGQNRGDEQDGSIARFLGSRTSMGSFETQFSRGRCPPRFYQLGNECLFFANDGKSHAWRQVDKVCSTRIARMLDEPSAGNSEQPNMQPTRGVRQLVLNTPEKTEILRALLRDYQEQNFAVNLPSDYNSLVRCTDGQDDKWPRFCSDAPQNSTCFETASYGPNDICLREVNCNERNRRAVCEFTLPGSPELIGSTFRTCRNTRGRYRRLPMWAWIAISIGSALLLLIILGIVFACVCKSRRSKGSSKRSFPEPRPPAEKVIRLTPKRDDLADQPMLVRANRTNEPDTGYLQPRSSSADVTANA